MTILFVTHYTELYGANRSMLTLVQMLQSKYGIQPIILLPYKDGPLLKALEDRNIPYHYMPFNRWLLTYMEEPIRKKRYYIKWHIKNALTVFKIKKMLGERKIDAVYSNSITIDIGSLLAFALHIPHIWHLRESIQQFKLKLTLPVVISKQIIHLSTNKRFILLSDFMVREYQCYLPDSKIRRIYNGVSLPKGAVPRPVNQLNNSLQLACVGLLCPQKNQLELLKALVILREKQISVHAHLVGKDDHGYINEMNSFIERHHLQEMVTIHGHSDNVFSILQTCNLGIVTAEGEAFGRVTIEYMLMRMPVIAADSGANPELIDAGETGMIYHLGNVIELANAIQTYVKNSSLLDEQGNKAYLKAVNEFSAERNADLIFTEIENAVKEK